MLLAIEFDNLHQILRSLYTDMMPLCGNMAGVAKGIAGLGALFYVAAKVWQSLASAEPIDVYPLLRPFVIGFCIMFFPTFVLGTINSVMSPVVKGCNNMLETQTFDMNAYREQKDKLEYEAMVRNPETAYLVSDEAFDKQIDELGWSAKDIATMGGMYMDRAATISSNPSGTGSGNCWNCSFNRQPRDRHYPNLFLDCPCHTGSDSLCHQCI